MKSRRLFTTSLLSICLLVCGALMALAQSANQWRQLTPLEGGNVFALLEQGGRVYAGVAVRGVFVSTDGGATWRESNNGLNNSAGNITVNALAAAGANILAATNTGIYLSNNGGQSWALVGADSRDVRSLAISSAGVFAGDIAGRVFRSSDNGQTWVERTRIANNPAVNAMAVLGSDLFAGTARGLFRSSDQGQTWTAVTAGLPNNGVPVVSALAVNGNTLYLGTNFYRDAANNALPQVYASGDGQSWMAVGD